MDEIHEISSKMKLFDKYRFGFDVCLPAVLFATGFAVCHLIFAIMNFINK